MALPSKHYNPETGNLEYPDMTGLSIGYLIAIIMTAIVFISVLLIVLLK